jgi:aldehyde dehydrogenase (NAD+)
VSVIPLLIDGKTRSGEGTFHSIDPFTGQPWAEVAESGRDDVDAAVGAARRAFDEGPWGRMSGRERSRLMRNLAGEIEAAADDFALWETRDNGKLLREMSGQMRSLAEWYDYFAGFADKIEGRVVDTGRDNFVGLVMREPVGVVAAVIPWNSPLLQLTWKTAAALAAGCTIVAKPSEHAPVSIMRFAELFERAGFPPGVFNAVSGESREVGGWLVGHPGVDHVSFTGSEITGAAVARAAAEHHASVTLELGGKSANIVFPDADLDAAANGLIAGVFAAAGQTCIAGSRGLVHADVFDDVVERVARRAESIRMGDPKDLETELGPICFSGQRDKIRTYVQDAAAAGARIVTGGGDRGLGGLFYEPTVVTGVTNDSPICRDELFGPVLSMIPFHDEAEAVAIANDSRFGLAAGVWTADVRRVFRVVKQLRVGIVWANAYRTSNFAMPFGGRKSSGHGRENGIEGVQEFLVDKAVWLETSGATRDPFVLG